MSDTDIKEIIHENRLKAGLTMKALADMVGVSEATISRWESGNIASMKHSQISSLCQALHISPALLVPGIEVAPSTPSEPEYTEEEKGIVRGYRKAPDNLKQVVKLTLQPYMVEAAAVAIPEKVEAAAVTVAIPEKAKTIIAFLKPFGVDCEYWDKNEMGKPGDFIVMTTVFDKFQGEEGRPHSSNMCFSDLEGLYKELKPVMDASGMKRKELIDKFITDTFSFDIAVSEDIPYRSANATYKIPPKIASELKCVVYEDGNTRLERIKSKETPADSKPADKKEAEG